MSLDSRLRLSGIPRTYPDLVRSSWRPGQSGFRMAVIALAVMPKGNGCVELVKLAWHDPPLNRHSWTIILRCRVPRERVLWRHALGELETLVDVEDAEVICADRPRIEHLARRSLRLYAKGLRQWNAMNADLIREPERWNKVPE